MTTFLRLVGLLFACAAGPAPAQQVTWVNLEGPWRYSPTDDPRHAAPEFDDRAWQTRHIPLGVRGLAQTFWLRRTVALTIEPRPLTLTIGVLAPAYEVYVNGVRIGATGPLDSEHAEIPRPRSFPIPASVVRPDVTIALRAFRARGGSGAFNDNRVEGPGPWLLTDPVAAPLNMGRLHLMARKLSNGLDAMQGPLMLCFAGIALMGWLRARRQMDFLWMAIWLAVAAGSRFYTYVQIDADSRPFGAGHLLGWILGLIHAALLTELAAATLGVRGFSRAVWIVTAAGSALRFLAPDRPEFYWTIWILEGLTLWIAARGAFREESASSWRGRSRWLVASAVVALCLFHGSRWANWPFALVPNTLQFDLYTLSLPPAMITVASLAFTGGMVLRLLRDREERLRLSNELAAARVVQQLVLSTGDPSQTEYAIDAAYEPAQEVGGDFFQTLALDGGGLLVAVGDVSGKGLKAAMVVSMVVGVLRSHRHLAPANLLGEMNRVLAGSLDGGFVTCLIVRLDPGGACQAANAGHLAPYWNGREVELENGLPLGLIAGAEFAETCLVLESDAIFTLISDGVVEAENAQRELFGFERTRELSINPARAIAEAAKAWGQNDDITVVTVRRSA